MLVSDPTGQSLQMSTQLLKGTPFSDFRVPGLLLFIALGVGATIPLVGHIARARWAVSSCLMLGLALIGWIIIQVLLVGFISRLQPLYAIVGIAVVAISYKTIRQSLPSHAA